LAIFEGTVFYFELRKILEASDVEIDSKEIYEKNENDFNLQNNKVIFFKYISQIIFHQIVTEKAGVNKAIELKIIGSIFVKFNKKGKSFNFFIYDGKFYDFETAIEIKTNLDEEDENYFPLIIKNSKIKLIEN